MEKTLEVVQNEVAVEICSDMSELGELQLALVGGGIGETVL